MQTGGPGIPLLEQLRKRSVFRVGLAYLVTAWLVLQVVATAGPILDVPDKLQKFSLYSLIAGFPIALILAWVYEIGPGGIRRDTGQYSGQGLGRKLDFFIIGVLAVALILSLVDRNLSANRPETSVAVLPFTNMSGSDANEPFTIGVHDDLLTQLSRIESIRTVSRTSVLRYRNTDLSIPQIATELDVATVLQGGVQRAGDRVRINVQLVSATADEHLWAETYDRELSATNVFEIQSEIARSIAQALRARLSDDDRRRLANVPTDNIEALDAYFIGKQLLEERTRDSLAAAVEYFEIVVELDPEFALGWSGLADGYMLLPEYSANIDRELVLERSQFAVARALELDPNLPQVKSSAAWDKLIHDYDWQGAEKTFREALAVVPDNTNVLHWLSHTLSWQGRHKEALDIARQAVEVAPLSKLMRMNLAYILIDAGRFDEGLGVARSVREEHPEYSGQRRNLFFHELRAGEVEMAAESFVGYTVFIGGDRLAAEQVADMFVAWKREGQRGVLSEQLLRRSFLGSEDLAQVLAFIGDFDGVIDALEVAIGSRSGSRSVLSMRINPAYDHIREDPRFLVLLAKVGLSD